MFKIVVRKHYQGKRKHFEVVEPFNIPKFDLTIPKGFVTDGASVPRLLWPAINPTGNSFDPSVVHDFFYIHNNQHNLTRLQVEAIFYEHLRLHNVSVIQAIIMLFFTITCGRGRWRKFSRIIN